MFIEITRNVRFFLSYNNYWGNKQTLYIYHIIIIITSVHYTLYKVHTIISNVILHYYNINPLVTFILHWTKEISYNNISTCIIHNLSVETKVKTNNIGYCTCMEKNTCLYSFYMWTLMNLYNLVSSNKFPYRWKDNNVLLHS